MRIAALIMAAGAASRFGSCKHLIEIKGKSILQSQVDHLRKAGINDVFIITGAWREEHAAANINDAQMIYNPTWQNGLGDSIAYGVKHIMGQYEGVLITLGDLAAIRDTDYIALLKNFDGKRSVCAFYNDSRGVPALFTEVDQKELVNLYGDKGAKHFLTNCASMYPIKISAAAIDIDTPEDLKQLQDSH